MKEGRTTGAVVTLIAFAFGLLALGSPVQADFMAIWAGFPNNFPAPYINGGTEYTKNSKNAVHFWSSGLVFDPDTGSIEGEGHFTMYLKGGGVIQGHWEATKFLSWRKIGQCDESQACIDRGFPASFTAGRMRAQLLLHDGDGHSLGNARLTVYCSLPGIPYAGGIEQYVLVWNGLRFNVGSSGTVFIDLG